MPASETSPLAARPAFRARIQAWWCYIKTVNIIFGLVVFALGLGFNFVPLSFGLKDLISGAVVGAGIATILAEFTFASERRESEKNQQSLTEQQRNLMQRVDILRSLSAKSLLYQNSRLYRLGMDLALLQWQKTDSADDLLELADVLGVRESIEQFASLPDRQSQEAVSLLPGIREAVELHYPREGVDNFAAGFVSMSWICMGGPGDDSFNLTKKTVLALEVQPEIKHYLEDSFQAVQGGKFPIRNMIPLLGLLGLYISSLTTGSNPDIVAFFERDRLPITTESTVQRMQELLQKVEGGA